MMLIHRVHDAHSLGDKVQYLPGQRASQEVHEHVSEGLHVVPSRILDTLVRVHGGVASRPHHALTIILAGYTMLLCDRVFEILHESKVNGIDCFLMADSILIVKLTKHKRKSESTRSSPLPNKKFSGLTSLCTRDLQRKVIYLKINPSILLR